MSSQTRQIIYGSLAVIGFIATWYFNYQFFFGLESAEMTFSEGMYANNAAASISNDAFVILAVFLFWSFHESKRLGMKHWWVYVLVSFFIALAVAFPLFLLARERTTERRDA